MIKINLLQLLERRNIRVIELSRHLDVSTQAIYGWIGGKREPRLAHIEAICKFLNCQVNELILIDDCSIIPVDGDSSANEKK